MKHRRYVARRMAEIQTELCREAIATGVVNLQKREILLKYKEHLKHL